MGKWITIYKTDYYVEDGIALRACADGVPVGVWKRYRNRHNEWESVLPCKVSTLKNGLYTGRYFSK